MQEDLCDFKANVVCRVSFGTAKVIQRKSVMKNQGGEEIKGDSNCQYEDSRIQLFLLSLVLSSHGYKVHLSGSLTLPRH